MSINTHSNHDEQHQHHQHRQRPTEDAMAFHVHYYTTSDDPSSYSNNNNNNNKSSLSPRVVATVKLYPRLPQGTLDRFVPSRALAKALFPSFLSTTDYYDNNHYGEEVNSEQEQRHYKKSASSSSQKKSSKKKRQYSPLPNSSYGTEISYNDGSKGGGPNLNHNTTSSTTDNNNNHSSKKLGNDNKQDSVIVTQTLTMDETISAILQYAETRNLINLSSSSLSSSTTTDSSNVFIDNDETLSYLFGCDNMICSAIRGLLISRRLLSKVRSTTTTPSSLFHDNDGNNNHHHYHEAEDGPSLVEAPIILTYNMKQEDATPTNGGMGLSSSSSLSFRQSLQSTNSDMTAPNESGQSETDIHSSIRDTDELTTTKPNSAPKRRAPSRNTERSSKKKRKQEEMDRALAAAEHIPHILSCDINVDVPSLYHSRTRDILRLIKRREHEYTTSRSRALKLLLTASSLSGSTTTTNSTIHSSSNTSNTSFVEEKIKHGMEQVLSRSSVPCTLLLPLISLSSSSSPSSAAAAAVSSMLGRMHIHLALAKAAPPSSEARTIAFADARIQALLERIGERRNRARDCWEVLESLHELTNTKEMEEKKEENDNEE